MSSTQKFCIVLAGSEERTRDQGGDHRGIQRGLFNSRRVEERALKTTQASRLCESVGAAMGETRQCERPGWAARLGACVWARVCGHVCVCECMRTVVVEFWSPAPWSFGSVGVTSAKPIAMQT